MSGMARRESGPEQGQAANGAVTAPLVLTNPDLPAAQGLYDPRHEKDACGVGFIADMKNRKSHAVVQQGLQILLNIDHRGAVGADPKLGDGCGILTQIPHRFFRKEAQKEGQLLPNEGDYGVAMLFFPHDDEVGVRDAKRVFGIQPVHGCGNPLGRGLGHRILRFGAVDGDDQDAVLVTRQNFVGQCPSPFIMSGDLPSSHRFRLFG